MRSVGKRAGDESGKHPVNEDDEENSRVPVELRGRLPSYRWFHVIAGALATKQSISPQEERKNGLLRFARNDGKIIVMAGLDPAIHAFPSRKNVDARDKPGHDVVSVDC